MAFRSKLSVAADGSEHGLLLIDNTDSMCTLIIDLPQLTSCSDSCALDAAIIEVICSNAGTNQTESDDEFYAVISVTGTNITGDWQSDTPPFVSGTIGETDTLGPFLIADGDIILNISGDNPVCPLEVTLPAPPPCSSCEQSINNKR